MTWFDYVEIAYLICAVFYGIIAMRMFHHQKLWNRGDDNLSITGRYIVGILTVVTISFFAWWWYVAKAIRNRKKGFSA